MPRPRLLTAEERHELDELVAEQAHEDARRWSAYGEWPKGTRSPRYALSLDMPIGVFGEDPLTLGEWLTLPADFTAFGDLRRLMELNVENTLAAARKRQRVGLRRGKHNRLPEAT